MKNETEYQLEKTMDNGTRSESMHRLQALKAFEKWKTEFKSGNKTERTPETTLDWGTRPGEVYRFGEPCWSSEDYNKWLYSKDKNDTEF